MYLLTPVPNDINGNPAYPLPPFCIKELDTCSSNAELFSIVCNSFNSARYLV